MYVCAGLKRKPPASWNNVEVSFLWIHLFPRKLILPFVFLPYIIDIQCQGTEDNQEVEYTVILPPLGHTIKETRIDHC